MEVNIFLNKINLIHITFLIKLLIVSEKGLELAERLSSIFYQNNFEALKNLNIDEFEKYCDKEMLSKLLLTPGITVVEAAVKAGVFPTEGMLRISLFFMCMICIFFINFSRCSQHDILRSFFNKHGKSKKSSRSY